MRLIAALLIATMFMVGKVANAAGVSLPEMMFWRQAVALPMLLGYLAAIGGLSRLRTKRIGSHAARAGVGMTGMFSNFAAAILLPLAEATTLNFAAPLFAVIIAALVLRDRVGPWRWMSVALGFGGILVITQPGHAHIPALGAAAGLVSAFLNATISFQIRDLSRTEEPVSVVFYFALFGTILMSVFMPFYMVSHDRWQLFLLVMVGVTGTLGQLFMTASLRLGQVTSVIIMDYSQIIWATLFGWLIWNTLPASSTWIGMPLVVAAGLVIAWREHKLARNYSVTPAENE
ncbi:MAG: DMT family transporter [Novosphingobium sp.]